LFLGDPSERGIKQAYGTMVSYRYVLDRVADNQVAYALDHRVDASNAVRALAAEAPGIPPPPPRTARERMVAAMRRLAARARIGRAAPVPP
jgi:hypothetical protein